VKFGVLDSAPVRHGGTNADALVESLARAELLDEIGCHRLWFTEHHLAPDVASSSPLTLVGQSATRTARVRLGAGGVMIRNHPPLVVAETVATLTLLHPGRVDLGLGRSGGSDHTTDARIRRTIVDYVDFEEDVNETVYHLAQLKAEGVEVFVLASSPATASFAGRQGLGVAVAGHVAPAGIDGAITAYRESFRIRPGGLSSRPRTILCLPILVASTDDEARWWFRSVQQRYLDRLRTGGAPMVAPIDAELDWSSSERYRVQGMLDAAIMGSPETAERLLDQVRARWSPDELMAMTDLPSPEATMNSHTHLAELLTQI